MALDDTQQSTGMDDMEPIEIVIDGVLDLHAFHPRDVTRLVPDYIDACLERGIYQVRIIHGKGTGKLRQAVREALGVHPHIRSFEPGGVNEGGDGVTVAKLQTS